MNIRQAIEISIGRARPFYTSNKQELLKILEQADKALGQRLANLRRRNFLDTRFTYKDAEAYRLQIRYVMAELRDNVGGFLQEKSRYAVETGVGSLVSDLHNIEKSFVGIVQPLNINQGMLINSTIAQLEPSLLRRHVTSLNRYGNFMVSKFEESMKVGILTGITQAQMIDNLVEVAPKSIAETLSKNEPAYFPKPTSFIKERYWAERIVRTERAYAYNAAKFTSMIETDKTYPMKKRIVAVMDNRTAKDSIYVHGQLKELKENFVDGAGRQYLYPPARPNDRETVFPVLKEVESEIMAVKQESKPITQSKTPKNEPKNATKQGNKAVPKPIKPKNVSRETKPVKPKKELKPNRKTEVLEMAKKALDNGKLKVEHEGNANKGTIEFFSKMNDEEFRKFVNSTLATLNYNPNTNEMRVVNGTHRIAEAKRRGFDSIPVVLLAYKDADKSTVSYNFGKLNLSLKNVVYDVRKK